MEYQPRRTYLLTKMLTPTPVKPFSMVFLRVRFGSLGCLWCESGRMEMWTSYSSRYRREQALMLLTSASTGRTQVFNGGLQFYVLNNTFRYKYQCVYITRRNGHIGGGQALGVRDGRVLYAVESNLTYKINNWR